MPRFFKFFCDNGEVRIQQAEDQQDAWRFLQDSLKRDHPDDIIFADRTEEIPCPWKQNHEAGL